MIDQWELESDSQHKRTEAERHAARQCFIRAHQKPDVAPVAATAPPPAAAAKCRRIGVGALLALVRTRAAVLSRRAGA